MTNGEESILKRIAARTCERVAAEKVAHPLATLAAAAEERAAKERAAHLAPSFSLPFERALRAPDLSLICECKRASPSRGLIAADFDPVGIAREYEDAGADAISCLTEPFWFQGADKHLERVAQAVSIPVLRKDFVVDEYMIYQAKAIGADAVLLICAILGDAQLKAYIGLCEKLGLTALVEAYEPEELSRALEAGARVVGVNNRDLHSFELDFGRSIELKSMVGPDRVFVSESGIRDARDLRRLAEAGVDAVLVGEALMRRTDRRAALDELRGGLS